MTRHHIAVALLLVLTASTIAAQERNRAALELARIARLRGAPQQHALKDFLLNPGPEAELMQPLLYHERSLHNALLSLLRDPQSMDLAAGILAYLGYSEGRSFVLDRVLAATDSESQMSLPARFACELFDPRTEKEWSYLRASASGQYDEREVSCAIRALKLIASPRSRRILEEALGRQPAWNRTIRDAIQYAVTHPPAQGRCLESLATRTARAATDGEWLGNEPPRYNKERNIALVDASSRFAGDRFFYTATFHRKSNVWKTVSFRMTGAASPPPPPPPR